MLRARVAGLALALVGSGVWLFAALAVAPDLTSGLVLWVIVLVGPAWAYSLCLVSDEEDFATVATRGRDEWLRVLPWTFVLAPMVIPTVLWLGQFFRDVRADGGRTWLGSGRSRPGEGSDETWR